ncbi:MAG: CBS domain-containing protein [Candidatus Acidoferrales bacterium]
MPAPKFVREIMTRGPTSLDHDARLLDAALVMRSSGFRHLPVVNSGRVVGLISDRDVQRASPSMFKRMSPEEYNRIFETTPIEKIMATDPVTVRPDTPLTEVVKLMHEGKFGSVPVVEGDKQLVGIVTVTDLLGVLSSLLSKS